MINNLPKSLIETATLVIESTLYETILILEDRIEFLKSKNEYMDTSHDLNAVHKNSSDIIDHFANNADPSKNKSYSQWIISQYKSKKIKQEDANKIHDVISSFDRYKPNLDKKDINQYKSLSEIESEVSPHIGSAVTRKEKSKVAQIKGRSLIHEDESGLQVFRLENSEEGKKASQDIYGGGHELGGAHTNWCTASRGNKNEFDSYNKSGNLYVIHTPSKRVYQAFPHRIDYEGYELRDSENKPVKGRSNSDAPYIAKGLGKIPNGNVLKVLHDLPSSKEDIHSVLSHSDSLVRGLTFQNADIKPEHIEKGLSDEEYNVRFGAAAHPNITTELLHKAINDPDVEVVEEALRNKNITSDHIHSALFSKHDFIREIAAAHPNTSSENLYKAIQDKSKKVRMAAAKNKNATKEHVLAALEMAHKEL